MGKEQFIATLRKELNRISHANAAKRFEKVIEGFSKERSPKAIIGEKSYRMFNSNDYLRLRFHQKLKAAEHAAAEEFGTGPGAVRFISGTLKVHRDLEKSIAAFHGRDDAIVFSSAFALNLAVLFCLVQGQATDSVIEDNVLVISDARNHRSIVDGIRIANLQKGHWAVFDHRDLNHLDQILVEKRRKFQRVVVITDGIFSMLGVAQDLQKMRQIIDHHSLYFPEGIWLVIDDSHGVGAFGRTGRGVEEAFQVRADLLIGTLGKAFGANGGYIVAEQTVIDYLRESAATYIYSNSISPGTAGAALASIQLVQSTEGQKLLCDLDKNRQSFQKMMGETGAIFAAHSTHPIQPLLIGDAYKTGAFMEELFRVGILVTKINHPVVPMGKEEIRIQISAGHTQEDLEVFAYEWQRIAKKVNPEVGLERKFAGSHT
jgi:glycine C-acetyltransferase